MALLRANSSPVDNFDAEFKLLANEISRLGAEIGVRIIPYRDPEIRLFCSQDSLAKKKIISDLSIYLQICQNTVANGHSVADSAMLTWNAIKLFGLSPPSDLFTHITSENVVEVHNREGIQIFRNFMFYTCCSY